MSNHVLTWARGQRPPTPAVAAVLLVLADAADDYGRCWLSVRTIAAGVGLSDRSVQRALRTLENLTWMTRERRIRSDGSETSSTLVLQSPAPVTPRCHERHPPVTPMSPPGDTHVTPPVTPASPLEPSAYPIPLSVSDEPERVNAGEPDDEIHPPVDPFPVAPFTVEPFPVDAFPVDPYPVDPEPIALTAEIIPISPAVARSAARRAAGAAKRRPTPLPDDFSPDDTTTRLIREIGLSRRQVTDAIDQMRDWHLANGQTKADWQATLRGWLRRDRDRPLRLSGPGTRPDPAGVTDAAAEALRIIRARHQA